MKNWTIKKRILFGFASVLTLVGILSVAAIIMLRQIQNESDFMDSDVLPGTEAMTHIKEMVSEIQIKTLRVLLATSTDERKKFMDEISANRAAIGEVMDKYDRTITFPEDRAMFTQLKTSRDAYIGVRGQLFEMVAGNRMSEAIAFNAATVRPAYQAYQDITDKLLEYNLGNANKSSATTRTVVHRANVMILTLAGLVMLIGITVAVMITTGLNRALGRVSASLGDGSAMIVTAASQVSAASQTLAEGASEQAASLEETSASVEELSSITKRNAENAQKANEITRQARASADAGAADMQAMNQAMEAIKNSSDDIAKIIKTIDEIAFQTNILALNAAVEAARAGEAGMGFAVVADEVRNLAQRCAQSAKETSAKIEGAITTTAQGVELSAKVTNRLAEIVTQVRKVDELAAEVANASSEQSQGISQVGTAVSQIDKVTQSNAASAEESASAAQEMNAQAEALKQVVNELLLLTGQNVAARAPESKSKPVASKTVKPRSDSKANGNGHSMMPRLQPALTASRKSEIPLDGEFKDF